MPTSGLVALQGIRAEGRVEEGHSVLVNGAGGGVGTFAVQIAKAYGAEVTAVDSTPKLDLLRSIGANQVIDYTKDDFTQGPDRYDLILDVPGNHSFSECRRVLTPTGTYVLIGHDHLGRSSGRWLGGIPGAIKLVALSPFISQLPNLRDLTRYKDPLNELKELLEAGKVTPVIDRTYPLNEVPQAMRYLEEEGTQEKVVITV